MQASSCRPSPTCTVLVNMVAIFIKRPRCLHPPPLNPRPKLHPRHSRRISGSSPPQQPPVVAEDSTQSSFTPDFPFTVHDHGRVARENSSSAVLRLTFESGKIKPDGTGLVLDFLQLLIRQEQFHMGSVRRCVSRHLAEHVDKADYLDVKSMVCSNLHVFECGSQPLPANSHGLNSETREAQISDTCEYHCCRMLT